VEPVREKRRSPRRPLRYTAWVAVGDDGPLWGCQVANVSALGARIDIENAHELPEVFDLLLTGRGNLRRTCRVIWRKHKQLGVRFRAANRGAPAMAVESPSLAWDEVNDD